MLEDLKRFPRITYEAWKAFGAMSREMIPLFPWHRRLLFSLLMPKSFRRVDVMKKLVKFMPAQSSKLREDARASKFLTLLFYPIPPNI